MTNTIAYDRDARRALIVLTSINLFNYIDRYVVSALLESLKVDLSLSDTQLGSLMTSFVVVYMLTSPIFGALGDRYARPPLLALGVAIWSAATALGGFAGAFFSLFVARAMVGVGEAAYGTISPGLIADYYPAERRGRIFAVFFAAIPIGSALGYVLGGLVDAQWGWRAAFFIAGVPGLLLALAAWRLRDPPRGASEVVQAHAPALGKASARATYLQLIRNRPYVLAVLGYAAYTFALGGLAFWMPAFLERVRGVPKAQATVQFGAIVVATGLIGTLAGGWLGDRLLPKTRQAYLWVSGISTLAAAPFALICIESASPAVYWSAMVVAELLLFASTALVNTAIVNVVAPGVRATAVALSILVMHLFGDVPSPPLIGAISDASSLGVALRIVPAAMVVGGLIWMYGAWSARDARDA